MRIPRRSPYDRPRRTERDARAVLAALERSGKPVRVSAEEHGLDSQRLTRGVAGSPEVTVPCSVS